MSIPIPKSQPSVQIEPGTYVARCYSMIHIGTIQYQWNGQMNKANKVRISFEFPTETHVFKEENGPEPFVISQEYTLSFGKQAKLKPLLEAWRGKPFTEDEMDNFDVTKLVGVSAMVTIIQNDKGYSDIASISRMPKGMECPPQANSSFILDYNDNWDMEKVTSLPEFVQKKIKSTPEYAEKTGQKVPDYPTYQMDSTEIPF